MIVLKEAAMIFIYGEVRSDIIAGKSLYHKILYADYIISFDRESEDLGSLIKCRNDFLSLGVKMKVSDIIKIISIIENKTGD